jgi:hypothetical protein
MPKSGPCQFQHKPLSFRHLQKELLIARRRSSEPKFNKLNLLNGFLEFLLTYSASPSEIRVRFEVQMVGRWEQRLRDRYGALEAAFSSFMAKIGARLVQIRRKPGWLRLPARFYGLEPGFAPPFLAGKSLKDLPHCGRLGPGYHFRIEDGGGSSAP